MVVWQGITEGGTAVPVQITEEGKVVAIGEAGPKGDPGEQGPPGPPGEPVWPPNPVEGAFLVWLNGEPTWYTEQPVPIPSNLLGPILAVNDNSLLTFADAVDPAIWIQGLNVVAADSNGNELSNWLQTYVWSDSVTGTPLNNGWVKENAFNGVLTNAASPTPGSFFTFQPPQAIPCTTGWRYFQGISAPRSSKLLVNGVEEAVNPSDTDKWCSMKSPPSQGSIFSVAWERIGGSEAVDMAALEIDGVRLVDRGFPGSGALATGQISTAASNTLLISRASGTWRVGDYVLKPEQTVASWVATKARIAAGKV